METLRIIPFLCGQFDDASDDESLGLNDRVMNAASESVGKRELPLTLPANHGITREPRMLTDTNRRRSHATKKKDKPENVVMAPVGGKPSVSFVAEVSDEKLPFHVLMTKRFPNRELRGSSSRANGEREVSRAKSPRVCTRLKAQPKRKVLPKTMSFPKLIAPKTARQATVLRSRDIGHEKHELKQVQELPEMIDALSTMTKSSSKSEVTPKVTVAAIRATEVETAEVLRSLRQTNKMSRKQPIPKQSDKASNLTKQDDDIEVFGVFPRPSERNSRTSGFASPPRALKSSGSNDSSPMSMLPCKLNDKRKREDFPTHTQDLKKRRYPQEELFGQSRPISGPRHMCRDPSAPTSVTPPLSSLPSLWEKDSRGKAELSLGSQSRQWQQTSRRSEMPAPVRKQEAVPTSKRVMRPTLPNVPQFQAPRLLFATTRPAHMPQHKVVCVLPPHLLPPPVMPTMRSKMAVEGFVAPINVPTVQEDKERTHPIPNAGLRKRDVLFFAPLVRHKVQHYGTLQYCFLCFKYQALYLKSNSTEKRELLNNLVRYVRAHGGRFLEWDEKQSCWYEIGDVRAAHRTMLGFSKDAPPKRDETTKR